MDAPYLEVTYRRGRPFAAYLHLSVSPSAHSHRCSTFDDGVFVVDFDRRNRPLGVEIVHPMLLSLESFNLLLTEIGVRTVRRRDLAPLLAA